MGVARGLAGDRAQAEAARGVEARRADAAVVERDALALAVFEEELAVIGAGQCLADLALGAGAVEAFLGEEEAIGDRKRRVERHRGLLERDCRRSARPEAWITR
jgi:glutathione S-transferase